MERDRRRGRAAGRARRPRTVRGRLRRRPSADGVDVPPHAVSRAASRASARSRSHAATVAAAPVSNAGDAGRCARDGRQGQGTPRARTDARGAPHASAEDPARGRSRRRQAGDARGRRPLPEGLEELGTTFVKLGQLLSSRPDLLPDVYIDELTKLVDDVTPLPFAPLRQVIDREIGLEHFTSIDETPLATASIAQIHSALLKTGRQVVVKVRRPGIVDEVQLDLDLLRKTASIAENHSDTAQLLQLNALDRRARAASARRARLSRGGAQRGADRRGDRRVP